MKFNNLDIAIKDSIELTEIAIEEAGEFTTSCEYEVKSNWDKVSRVLFNLRLKSAFSGFLPK